MDPAEGAPGYEDCDDGNGFNGDACLNSCRASFCGDGVRCLFDVQEGEAGFEECDDGNNVEDDGCDTECRREPSAATAEWIRASTATTATVNGDGCLLSCQTARCGDGVLHLGEEQCDDGNNLQTDNCLVDCTVARCGDGHVRDGVETCDDGNGGDDDGCRINCQAARCGDGIRRQDLAEDAPGYEACDDGNADNGDTRLSNCLLARCGDGVVQDGVEADDGNNLTDACLNDCSGGGVAAMVTSSRGKKCP